jgi:Homeodomain-like domain
VGAGRTRKRRSEAQRLRALELVDAGWSWAAAGREVGAAKQTVGTWIRKRQLQEGEVGTQGASFRRGQRLYR